MPLLLAVGIAYIDLYSYYHKSYWRENLLFAFLLLLLGFIPLILYLSGNLDRAHSADPVHLCKCDHSPGDTALCSAS